MKLLSSLLLTWATITVGGVAIMVLIVAAAETYTKVGWLGVTVLLAFVSGVVALPVGVLLRFKG